MAKKAGKLAAESPKHISQAKPAPAGRIARDEQ
jgi:hypothetical protein